MIDSIDLAEMRTSQNQLMPQTYQLFRLTRTSDSYGSYSTPDPVTPTSSGSCRIMRFPRKSYGIVTEISDKLRIEEIRVLTVPYNADVQSGDLILSNGKYYDIVNILIEDTPYLNCKKFLLKVKNV